MFTYSAEIIRVVDGDTIDVDIDLGFDMWLRNVRLRLDRIDAYETRLFKGTTEEEKQKGLEAKQYLEDLFKSNKGFAKVTTTKRGSFGRWIAEVIVGDMNVNDNLVNLGYAVYKDY